MSMFFSFLFAFKNVCAVLTRLSSEILSYILKHQLVLQKENYLTLQHEFNKFVIKKENYIFLVPMDMIKAAVKCMVVLLHWNNTNLHFFKLS